MLTSCSNFVYEERLIHYVYPTLMAEVNVSATVGMSAIVGKMSATVEKLHVVVLGNLKGKILISEVSPSRGIYVRDR